jgi:hypothetical protein
MFESEEDAVEIDGLLSSPICQAEFGDQAGDRDSGIVHKHVKPAECLLRPGDNPAPVIFVRNVLMNEDRSSVCPFDPGDTFFAEAILKVSHDDRGTFASEKTRTGSANTACAASYQRNFSEQLSRMRFRHRQTREKLLDGQRSSHLSWDTSASHSRRIGDQP